MYLPKESGPRVVTLADGSVLSRADLPPADTVRWVPRRKALVARAVTAGLIDAEAAARRYRLAPGELDAWIAALAQDAPDRLKLTRSYAARLSRRGVPTKDTTR